MYWPANHHGPVNSNGTTGFQTTAIANRIGSHHHCRAWKVNQAMTSAMIARTYRMITKESLSTSATPTTATMPASKPGASAVRWNDDRP